LPQGEFGDKTNFWGNGGGRKASIQCPQLSIRNKKIRKRGGGRLILSDQGGKKHRTDDREKAEQPNKGGGGGKAKHFSDRTWYCVTKPTKPNPRQNPNNRT